LAVSVQFYSQPEIISYVPKSAFWPQPKVDSSIIKLTPLPVIARSEATKQSFFQVVKAGFSHPRKLLMSNLSQSLKISKERLQETFSKLNLSSNTRAQNLSLENWKDLTTHLFA